MIFVLPEMLELWGKGCPPSLCQGGVRSPLDFEQAFFLCSLVDHKKLLRPWCMMEHCDFERTGYELTWQT